MTSAFLRKLLTGGLLAAAVLFMASCQDSRAELLLGDWQAVSITEAGDSMRLNIPEVGFSFGPTGVYRYRSTLNYQEAGRYRLKKGHLIAQDTTHPNSEERIVAIDKLTTDSLILRMQQDTLERVMVLERQ